MASLLQFGKNESSAFNPPCPCPFHPTKPYSHFGKTNFYICRLRPTPCPYRPSGPRGPATLLANLHHYPHPIFHPHQVHAPAAPSPSLGKAAMHRPISVAMLVLFQSLLPLPHHCLHPYPTTSTLTPPPPDDNRSV